jgi:hypothetical protein
MVDLLAERYGWAIEYVESLDFDTFDGFVRLISKKRIETFENERKNDQVGHMTVAKAVFFGLQANADLPPTKAEANRKKPNWPKIEKARRQMINMMEDYQKALSHPHYFAKHMGLIPAFAVPENEVQTTRLRTRQDIEDMRERMTKKLLALKERRGGDFDMRTGGPMPLEAFEEEAPSLEPASQAELNAELRR